MEQSQHGHAPFHEAQDTPLPSAPLPSASWAQWWIERRLGHLCWDVKCFDTEIVRVARRYRSHAGAMKQTDPSPIKAPCFLPSGLIKSSPGKLSTTRFRKSHRAIRTGARTGVRTGLDGRGAATDILVIVRKGPISFIRQASVGACLL
jgi:hypothetical protein